MTPFYRLFSMIVEAPPPSDEHKQKMWYHGTINIESARKVFEEGFKAREVSSRRLLAPIKGKVYLTPDLSTAMVYAMGGHVAGHKETRDLIGPERYGVIFEIPGTKLGDIQPDEDSVGEILKDTINWFDKHESPNYKYNWPTNMNDMKWLYSFAKAELTPLQWQKVVRHYDEAHLYDAGKKLVGRMGDWQKMRLINMGAHIANEGETIVPTTGWLIDRTETEKYKEDGSNFFEIAKKVTKETLPNLV